MENVSLKNLEIANRLIASLTNALASLKEIGEVGREIVDGSPELSLLVLMAIMQSAEPLLALRESANKALVLAQMDIPVSELVN